MVKVIPQLLPPPRCRQLRLILNMELFHFRPGSLSETCLPDWQRDKMSQACSLSYCLTLRWGEPSTVVCSHQMSSWCSPRKCSRQELILMWAWIWTRCERIKERTAVTKVMSKTLLPWYRQGQLWELWLVWCPPIAVSSLCLHRTGAVHLVHLMKFGIVA